MKPDLETRRARVRRVQAKRPRPAPPPVEVRVTYRPRSPNSLDELAALVLELLDARRASERR